MPKGGKKRTQEDYDREIFEASNRMRKYPEHLKSARNSKTWFEFLENIGIYENILETKQGQNFWNDVRDTLIKEESGQTPKWVAEHGAIVEFIKTKAKAVNYTTKSGKTVNYVRAPREYVQLRNKESGKFTSVKKIKERGY